MQEIKAKLEEIYADPAKAHERFRILNKDPELLQTWQSAIQAALIIVDLYKKAPEDTEETIKLINYNIRKNCNSHICDVCDGGGYDYDKQRDCTKCLASGITDWDFDYLNGELIKILTK